MPRFPSSDWISAVSSPQTNAPAPSRTSRCRENAEPRISEEAALLGLAYRGARVAHGLRVFGANVQVALGRANGVRRDGQPFEHTMRVGFEHQPVHECAGISLIAVADDIFDWVGLGTPERPFSSGRKARAAAPAQAGIGDRGDDVVGRESSFRSGCTDRSVENRGPAAGRKAEMTLGSAGLPAPDRPRASRATALGFIRLGGPQAHAHSRPRGRPVAARKAHRSRDR
jgi:hypothetical protein